MREIRFSSRRFLLIGFLLFCCLGNVQAQPLRRVLQAAVDSLLQQGEIRGQEHTFKDSAVLAIGQIARFDELLALTHHQSPLVRVAAIYGLLQRDEMGNLYLSDQQNYPRPFVPKTYLHRLLEEHFNDTATVQWRTQWEYNSISLARISVGELCLSKIGNYWIFSRDFILSDQYGYKMPQEAKAHFDSLLLLNLPNPWIAYRFARIQQLEPIQAWYSVIRQQVEQSGDEVAVCYLAKYQKPEDIDLILANLPTEKPRFEATLPSHWTPFQYFRHPRMFAYLQQHQPPNINKNETLYLVAAYQTPEAAALFDTMYTREKAASKNMWSACSTLGSMINAQFAPVYAPLLWKMLMDNPENSNIRIPDRLWETHADSLAKMYDIWKTGGRGARDRATKMFPKLSEYLAQHDVDRRAQVVVEQIKPGKEPRNAQKAWETIWLAHDKIYTLLLFGLLEKDPLPENRFFICKIMLHQPEADIKQQLITFFQKHPELYPNLTAAEKGGSAFSDFYHYLTEKK